jgi:hypothetical protein
VQLWLWGDPVGQPSDDTIFGAIDGSGNRLINSHCPYGTGHIYWDAAWVAPNFDRINKLESDASKYRNWNHYVFTKNTATGYMRIYQNGTEWYSVGSKTQNIAGNTCDQFLLACRPNVPAEEYDGAIEEFRLSKIERSANWIYAEYQSTKAGSAFALLRTYPE